MASSSTSPQSAKSKAQADAAQEELDRRRQGLKPRRFTKMPPAEIQRLASTDTSLLPSRKSRRRP